MCGSGVAVGIGFYLFLFPLVFESPPPLGREIVFGFVGHTMVD